MPASRFRMVPSRDTGETYSKIAEHVISATGTSDATAQNLPKSIALQGAERVILFIEVTAKNHGGGSNATKINVKYRVAHGESAPAANSDDGWAFIRADNLTAASGVSSTKPYTAEITDVTTDFDAGVKLHVLSFPAYGSYASARIWSDNACGIKVSWMRK